MDKAEKYAQWLVNNQDKKGSAEFQTVADAYKSLRTSAPASSQPQGEPLKIGAEGFRDAVKEVASQGFSRTDQVLGGIGSAADMMAMRLKQAVVGLTPQDEENVRQQRELAGATGATFAGNIGGNVMATGGPAMGLQAGATTAAAKVLPMAAAVPTGAAVTGAALATATNPVLKGESEAANAGLGAVGNVLGTYAAQGLSRLAVPIQDVSKSTLEMVKRGFSVTPGQASGPSSLINRIEQQLQSIGVFGWMIDKARSAGVKDMNVGAIREVVPSGTEKEITKAGREAVERAGELIDAAYDRAYAGIKGKVNADSEFWRNVNAIPRAEGIDLPPSMETRFSQLMQDRVLSRLKDASPETLRDIQNSIGALARKYRASGDPDQRAMGAAFSQAKTEFRDLVSRQASPEFRSALEALDGKYRDLIAIEKASGYTGSKEGIFSADALNRAAKGATKGMREFAGAAKDVYGATVADSGTAGRLLLPFGLGALGGSNAAVGGPDALTTLGVLGALAATPMAGRYAYGGYPGQQMTSQMLRELAPLSGQLGRAYANQ